ncbi:hypothetical protein EMIHUDRAFT_448401, partial [Emiliania huxleyi CCMP1516]|uniref:Uncharacterized protein n=2 Tax=Emiliania huxleyi TaxID=2903 RepID=A0A0D3IE68_EMIH1
DKRQGNGGLLHLQGGKADFPEGRSQGRRCLPRQAETQVVRQHAAGRDRGAKDAGGRAEKEKRGLLRRGRRSHDPRHPGGRGRGPATPTAALPSGRRRLLPRRRGGGARAREWQEGAAKGHDASALGCADRGCVAAAQGRHGGAGVPREHVDEPFGARGGFSAHQLGAPAERRPLDANAHAPHRSHL